MRAGSAQQLPHHLYTLQPADKQHAEGLCAWQAPAGEPCPEAPHDAPIRMEHGGEDGHASARDRIASHLDFCCLF